MKLNKFAYLYSKPLGNHTLKIMKKYLEIYFKKPGKIMNIWNFVSPKKWEPWQLDLDCSRTQVLYKAHVLYCALFSRSCFFSLEIA